MKFERDDAKIGSLVLATFGLFTALLFYRAFAALVKKETGLQVRLEKAADLAVGTEVQLQGLRVGQVNKIDLERRGVEYTFVAKLGLRPDIQLWEGTKAVLVAKPLGGAYLDLQLPPPAVRLKPLAPDALLEGENAASLGSVIDGVNDLVRNVNAGIDELRASLQKRGAGVLLDHPQVKQVLTDLDAALREAGTLARDGQGLVKQGTGATKLLERDLASLEKTLQLLEKHHPDLEEILSNLGSTMKETQALVSEIRATQKEIRPELDANLKVLNRNLMATEELLELLKVKPNRAVWGTPSESEKAAAKRRVEENRKAQEAGSAPAK